MTDPKIRECRANLLSMIDEIEMANDLDLWQEAEGKLNDLLIVYRRKGKPAPPSTFTFSDGVTRDIDRMAFAHACAAEFPDPEWDGTELWPAFMMREKNTP